VIRARRISCAVVVAVAALLAAVFAAHAHASTLYVGNNGVDGSGCGDATRPCRSIGQAVALASGGDRIVVGPGLYGDLSGDGSFGGAGDEAPPGDCACMIKVDRRLTIESSAGAAATVIDTGANTRLRAVRIQAPNAVFGTRNKGFTVRASSGLGIEVAENDVRVESNIVFGGLLVQSEGAELVGNTATGARQGFIVANGRATLTGNVARAATEDGFLLHGDNEVRGNVATGNGLRGFRIIDAGRSSVTGNIAMGNGADGLTLASGDNVEVRGNTFAANGQAGVRVIGIFAHPPLVSRNNFLGNGSRGDSTTGLFGCGIVNELGALVKATGNFWGTAAGPTGGSPADRVCNGVASTTSAGSVAANQFPIPVTPAMGGNRG